MAEEQGKEDPRMGPYQKIRAMRRQALLIAGFLSRLEVDLFSGESKPKHLNDDVREVRRKIQDLVNLGNDLKI